MANSDSDKKKDLLKKLEVSDKESLSEVFGRREDFSEPETESTDDTNNEAEDIDKEAEETLFQREMKLLDLSKEDILVMVDSVVSKGKTSEVFTLYGGRVSFTLESVTIENYSKFIDIFENLNAKVQTTIDFYYNLYTLSSLLVNYNGKQLPESIEERAVYIKENIPVPVFDALVKHSFMFGRKVSLLSMKEVADFF